MLGDHQLFRKTLPYEGSTHVPLLVAARNLDLPAQSSDALVCLEDICPTILQMAGVPVPAAADGRSLLPFITGDDQNVGHDTLFGEHSGPHANHWVIQGRWKYCWYATTGEEQLFDLSTDPTETCDRSAENGRLAPFRTLLADRLRNRTDYRFDPAKLRPAGNRPPTVFWPAV
jgi:arylsulfatase A-like enzyme